MHAVLQPQAGEREGQTARGRQETGREKRELGLRERSWTTQQLRWGRLTEQRSGHSPGRRPEVRPIYTLVWAPMADSDLATAPWVRLRTGDLGSPPAKSPPTEGSPCTCVGGVAGWEPESWFGPSFPLEPNLWVGGCPLEGCGTLGPPPPTSGKSRQAGAISVQTLCRGVHDGPHLPGG